MEIKQLTLRELRKNAGLTIREVSEKTMIPPTSYSAYEKEQVSMPARIFSELCDFYGISRDMVIIPETEQQLFVDGKTPIQLYKG